MTEYKSRWKGKSADEVAKHMTKLAHKKHAKSTVAERKAIAKRLVASRGSWKVVNGVKIYVRKSR